MAGVAEGYGNAVSDKGHDLLGLVSREVDAGSVIERQMYAVSVGMSFEMWDGVAMKNHAVTAERADEIQP